MRVFDQGAYMRVTVSREEVQAFKRTWPASGLRDRGYSFTFEKRSGNLVDTNVPESHDGQAAVALSHDAQKYGVEVLARRRVR